MCNVIPRSNMSADRLIPSGYDPMTFSGLTENKVLTFGRRAPPELPLLHQARPLRENYTPARILDAPELPTDGQPLQLLNLDGTIKMGAIMDGTVHTWTPTDHRIWRLGASATAVAFASTGELVIGMDNGQVVRQKGASANFVGFRTCHIDGVGSIHAIPNLVLASTQSVVELYDERRGISILTIHPKKAVKSVRWAPDNYKFAVAGNDDIRVYDIRQMRGSLTSFNSKTGVTSMDWYSGHNIGMTTGSNELHLCDTTDTTQTCGNLRSLTGNLRSLRYIHGLRAFAVGSTRNGYDSVHVYNIPKNKVTDAMIFPRHGRSGFMHLACTNDTVAFASDDEKYVFFDLPVKNREKTKKRRRDELR